MSFWYPFSSILSRFLLLTLVLTFSWSGKNLYAQFPPSPMMDVLNFQYFRSDFKENKVKSFEYNWGAVNSRLDYNKDGYLQSFRENYVTEHADTTVGYIAIVVDKEVAKASDKWEGSRIKLVKIYWDWVRSKAVEPFTTETLLLQIDDDKRITGIKRYKPVEPFEFLDLRANVAEKIEERLGQEAQLRELVRKYELYSTEEVNRSWNYEWDGKGQLIAEERNVHFGAGNVFYRKVNYRCSFDPKGRVTTILKKENVNDLTFHQSRYDYSFNRKGNLQKIDEFNLLQNETGTEEVHEGTWGFTFYGNGLLKMARNWNAIPRFKAKYEYF